MKIFSKLYDKVIAWAQHRHASYYLAGVSFIESSFFPIPPDVMLAPMVLAKPARAWQLAGLTTVASALGGCFGYAIGYFAYATIGQPIIEFLNLTHGYHQVVEAFGEYGIAIILLAGITPIPYKLFTIAAGVSVMPLVPFILSSLVGRAFRYYIVAALIKKFGAKVEAKLKNHIDRIGWMILLFTFIAFVLLKTF